MWWGTTCPDDLCLCQHLQGLLGEAEPNLIAHLDLCKKCQRRLELLGAGSEVMLRTARQVGESPAEPASALREVLEECASADILNPTVPLDAVDVLHYLDSTAESGNLGRVGHYTVLEVIGRGGMGVVLKAFDEQLQRIVAIKMLAPTLAASPKARQRFLREARAAAAIQNEYVVGIHAVEELGRLPYLVMDYIVGESLQERLTRDGPLELKAILKIGMETALGLAAAHSQGVIHRDIKPANLLLEKTMQRVKITDFGLARTIGEDGISHPEVIAGTPQYMAPEQARGETVDHRADLFSLGSVLFTLYTGHEPFAGGDTLAVVREVQAGRRKSVRLFNPKVPEWFADILAKLQAQNPVDRFTSAAEVADLLRRRLESFQHGKGISRRAILAATLVGVGGGVAAWLSCQPTQEDTDSGVLARPRRVLFVLPSKDFYYPLYITVRSALIKEGVGIVVAAPTRKDVEPDREHHPDIPAVPVDRLLSEVKAADYDAVYFCGGKGITEFLGKEPHAAAARRVIGAALTAKKRVAALANAPVVLADAGRLKRVRATCFEYGEPPGIYIRQLKEAGAIWVDEPVVVSGYIITGRDPADTNTFARELLTQIGVTQP